MAKIYRIITLIIVIVSFFYANKTMAEEVSKTLRGTQVLNYMESYDITPDMAYAKVMNYRMDIENTNDPCVKARFLYEMAKYKIFLGYKNHDLDYAKLHQEDYDYLEMGDCYIYNGNDLKTLIEEYPQCPIVDKAAFMLATMPMLGECEGDTACLLERGLKQYKSFFVNYQDSPLLLELIKSVNAILIPISSNKLDNLAKETKDQLMDILDTYKDILMQVKPQTKAYGLYPLALAYRSLGNIDQAKVLYKVIIDDCPNYEHIKQVHKEYKAL